MQCSVEISLYPLRDAYVPPIDAFLEDLRARPGIEVSTNDLSTHVHGDYEAVLGALTEAMRGSLEASRGVFVLKVLGIDSREPHPR
mgnify:FL=1